jgi:hypothetical protein
MPSTDYQRQRLAVDTNFLLRVRSAVAGAANTVLDEGAVTNHTERATYARTVLADLDAYAEQLAKVLVERAIIKTDNAIDYDYEIGAIVSAVTDANLKAEFDDIWDKIAGIE